MTWWTDYQARRGINRKSLYVNNMKNTISTEFKNSTSYNLVKINNVDRDVRIVEESSIIKNPNKKRLLCYPDETISIGDIVLWDSENWICTETDTTSQVSDVGIISKSNNTLTIYKNNTSYQIPCIINSNINLDTDETIYIETPSTTIVLRIPNTEITRQIKRGEIYKLGLQNYEIKDINDIVEPGILRLEIMYSQEVQEEHVYTIEILNGTIIDIQESTTLQLNINVYDNQILISPLPSLTFTSNNELIANVNENGLVTAYDVIDNCDITVSLDSDSSVFNSININVIEDVQNNITYTLTSTSLPDNEIIITQTKTYTIQKYNNGIPIEQNFSFNVVGDSLSYQLIIVDGNNCSVKCLKSGSVITLKAIDDNNGEIVVKDIRLKNLF